MSALYTIASNGEIFQVDQDVKSPKNIIRYSANNLLVNTNPSAKSATLNIWLNSIDEHHMRTNEDMAHEIKDRIRRHHITQIDKLSDFYKMTIDYELHDRNGREIEHSISVYPLKPVDSLIPIGITKHNELPFRFVKEYTKTIDFRFKDSIPFGIMQQKEDEYFFKINDIRIVQDMNEYDEQHTSIHGRPMIRGSHTIHSYLEHTVLIYSSKKEGIDFTPCKLYFIPRLLQVHFNIILDNFVVFYDENEIDKILVENIKIINDDDYEYEAEDYHRHHHPAPPRPRGIFVIAEPRKRDSFLVVEDMYPKTIFDESKMVRKHWVIHDIPSIQVGDYVRFVEAEDRPAGKPFLIFDDCHPEKKEMPCEYDHRHDKGRKDLVPPWLKE